MNQKKFVTIAVSMLVAVTLLVTYPLCMRLKHENERLETVKIKVDKLSKALEDLDTQLTHLETKVSEPLPPVAARSVLEFVVIASDPLPLQPASAAKPEPYENPDGDGAAYQDDVVPYVYDTSPSYVFMDDVPSDYPSP